jgi:hypothetical protein
MNSAKSREGEKIKVDRKFRAKDCVVCGGQPEPKNTRIVNHSLMWHDGDIICVCGRYVREFDAG